MFEENFNDIKSIIEEEIATENELAIYKVTDELDNYKYNDTGVYIPFKEDFYLKISRTESKKSELVYTWTRYNNNSFQTLTIYKSDKLINEGDKKLIANLMVAGKNAGIEIDEDEIVSFINTLKRNIIQSDCLNVLKEIEFEFPEEIDVEELDEQIPPSIDFTDYDEHIQKEAIRMLRDDKLFDNIIDNISWTHEGNDEIKKQIPLILSSVFIDQPVHMEINADTGIGKTDFIVETSKNYPSCYIHILRTVSPKNIYIYIYIIIYFFKENLT